MVSGSFLGGNGSNGTTADEMSPPQANTTSDRSNLMIAVASAFGTLVLGAMIVLLVFIGLYAVRGNKRRVQQYDNYTQITDPVDKQCNLSAVTMEVA